MSTKKMQISIRAAIEKSKFTQKQLAALVGCAQSTISRFLAGGNITGEHLDAIIEILGITFTLPTDTSCGPVDGSQHSKEKKATSCQDKALNQRARVKTRALARKE